MRRIGVEERRARLAVRHHLATAAREDTATAVAGGLTALHATDPATVHLAVAARLREPAVDALERALYDDRMLIRMLGMRRTMFVLPVDLAPVVHAACTEEIAARERRRTIELIRLADIENLTDPAAWFAEVEESTLRALAVRGEATAAELAADEPRLRHQVRLNEGKKYGGPQNLTTRVLFQLAAEGRIVRGRPRGSWISSQYRWSTVEAWLPGGMTPWSAEEARTELTRRWLARYGPATLADVRWWTGWTAGQAKRALAALAPVEVDLDGTPGLMLADDMDPVPAPAEPWVALLPALDPTPMGWTGRDWFLGDHAPALFDRSGNIGPTVWWDGRIVGGWAQRANGEVVFRLLEDVGADALAAVTAEAERLTRWLGPVRVTPRFRTPLERELTG